MRVIWLHWVSSSFRVYFSLFSFLLIYFFYPGRMMGADYCDYTMWPSYIHSCVCQIILWGKKLVTDHRNMSVANGLWLAVFMTLQFSFLRLVFIIDKGKKKKKKKRILYILLSSRDWLLPIDKQKSDLYSSRVPVIYNFCFSSFAGHGDLRYFIVQFGEALALPSANRKQERKQDTYTNTYTYTHMRQSAPVVGVVPLIHSS